MSPFVRRGDIIKICSVYCLYDSTCLSVIKFSSTSSVLVFQNCPIRTLYILISGLIGCFLSTRTKIVSFMTVKTRNQILIKHAKSKTKQFCFSLLYFWYQSSRRQTSSYLKKTAAILVQEQSCLISVT